MKPPVPHITGALVLVFACFSPLSRGVESLSSVESRTTSVRLETPESKLARLDRLVTLSPAQKLSALEIFKSEQAGLLALPNDDRGLKGMEFRQSARARIRALLTPEQRAKYNTTSQLDGGGRETQDPAVRVALLNDVVALTAAQRELAAQIFEEESEALMEFEPKERLQKGGDARRAAIAQVRAMLTPEQLKKYEAAPPSLGGGRTGRVAPPVKK